MKLTSEELAQFVGSEHVGPNVEIQGVDSIDLAGEDELTFWERDGSDAVESSDAGCVVCSRDINGIQDKSLIITRTPRIDFLKIVNEFYRTPPDETFVHETATIAGDARIGDRCWIGPHVYIGDRVTIGDRVKIQAGTSIGGEGFAFAPDDSGELWGQIHQGEVIIEDDVEIGSNCSIDRAIFKETVIGAGTKMDNLIHVAHQTVVGEDVWIAYHAGLAGSVTVGDRTMIHPNATVGMHVDVGEDVVIGMNAGVLDDIEPGTKVAGTPAAPIDRS